MLLLLTQMVFFQEIHIFRPSSWIGLYETKWAFLHLQNYDLQEVYLSKTNSTLSETMCYKLRLLTQMVFFAEIHVFLQLSWIHHLEQPEPISTLKTLICRQYFFQKLSQSAQGNNVLDAPSSNTDIFLWRNTCVSSSLLNRPILEQVWPVCTFKNLSCRKYCLQKLTQLSQETMSQMLLLLTQMVFSRDIHLSLQLSWIDLFGKMRAYFHLEKPTLQEVLLSKPYSILTGKQYARCSSF
jgi:hypothetical protein